jgi:hypothetical protein
MGIYSGQGFDSPIVHFYTRSNYIMGFWKKMFKKTKKENQEFHEKEMKYFQRLEKKMKKLEKNIKKRK